MLPDFNRLRVFFFVRQCGSVSEAAKAIGVTQSAVSQAIAKLESELGAQLFVRRHRRLVATTAAETLFATVAPFVDSLREGVEQIQRQRQELVGTVRVGAPVEFGVRRLVPRIAEFRSKHPAAKIELQLGHPSTLMPRARDGVLDLLFADVFDTGSPSWPGMELVPVLDEELVMVVHNRTERRTLDGNRSFRELSACSFVAYDASAPAIRSWFRHHFGKTPTRVDVALAVESVQAIIVALEAGAGFGVVPRHAVARALGRGQLTAITTRRRAMTNRISRVRRLDNVPSRLEREFVGFIDASDWHGAGRSAGSSAALRGR